MAAINNITAPDQQVQPVPLAPGNSSVPAVGGLSFKDVLDAVNPLQHIPLVSGMFRAASNEPISTASKLAGDTLYGLAFGGGILSVASTVADTAVQQATGTDMAGHIVNAASSLTAPDASTPLVADVMDNTPIQPSVPQESLPNFFPMDHNPAVTSGQYHRAQILDTVNQKLVQMVS